MRVILTPRDDNLRPAVERLIGETYASHYGARIVTFPDTLIAMVGDDGAVWCAAGMRVGAEGFFSEAYLDAPIDALLSALRPVPVRREKIFEVTSLACRAPHLAASFLREIIACGEKAGFEWSFFTATAPLKALLERMRLPLLTLAEAESCRVANHQTWGSYHAFAPRVYAVHRDSIGFCLRREAGAVAYG